MPTAKRRLTHEPERANPVAAVHIWRSPAGSAVDISVVAHLSAYSAIHQQAARSLPNETGGFLVGRVANDQRGGAWHLEIEDAVPVEPLTQDPVHFTFTWRDVDRVRQYREEHGKALIGWYHTHPDLGIFLSETDLEKTHRVLFSEPFQIALVYDPVRQRAGYFYWEGKQQIDAAPAEWREFDIAVAAETTDDRVEVAAPSPSPATSDEDSDTASGALPPAVAAASAAGPDDDTPTPAVGIPAALTQEDGATPQLPIIVAAAPLHPPARTSVPVASSIDQHGAMPAQLRTDETAAWPPEMRIRRLYPTAAGPSSRSTDAATIVDPVPAVVMAAGVPTQPRANSKRVWWIILLVLGLTIGIAAVLVALSAFEMAKQ